MSNTVTTGVLNPPESAVAVAVELANSIGCLRSAEVIIRDWTSGSPVVVYDNTFYISGKGTARVEFPLVNAVYSDVDRITAFEIIIVTGSSFVSACYSYIYES